MNLDNAKIISLCFYDADKIFQRLLERKWKWQNWFFVGKQSNELAAYESFYRVR